MEKTQWQAGLGIFTFPPQPLLLQDLSYVLFFSPSWIEYLDLKLASIPPTDKLREVLAKVQQT